MTDQTDYPPEKLAFLMATPTWCRKKAAEFGPHTEALITAILKEGAMKNLRKAQAILASCREVLGRYREGRTKGTELRRYQI